MCRVCFVECVSGVFQTCVNMAQFYGLVPTGFPPLHCTSCTPWSPHQRDLNVPGIGYVLLNVCQVCSKPVSMWRRFMNNLSLFSSPSAAPLGVHTRGVFECVGYVLLNVCQVCSKPVSIWRSFMDSFPLDFLPCTAPPAPLGVRTRGV